MLLIGKKFEEEKIRLYHAQNGICPLCRRALSPDIKSNHLDHDHTLHGPNAGKVRALLCNYCNALEGQLKHKFDTSGLKSKGVDISEYFMTLSEYYKKDLSEHNTHPAYINDLTKYFSKLDLDGMDNLAASIGLEFPAKCTKAKRVPLFKKALRLFLKDKQ
ncbi:endonuclease VII [Acinetobacter phage vB_AbaM_Konradin]|uniref:Endonuclease VII n=8 Tax=Lazarusvirus TaxID=2842820 RepID=A0A4Y1NLD2_9CAUD|nr:endonuclease VII [Acinetobacter phage vB_ApiM_fHyAci03]YP_009885295.1 endonuclease VII [Acinetobacter phage vB_AbaM_Konradin]YP_009886141.1 endonuclease VII [Acinetobacter phage vB_AbaM_Berthold]YP_009886386.1 endonuclease VII [Acinetobacter phage vB_AbaM_Apostate]YP_009886635.1 endonuclease VII [Acinetobacter phage vB_AbaM_Kimel]YP_009889742.1 endonuclease VII [Acinetobacter phage AM101]QKE55812.1 endonuclease VII [Acinetobacter phage Octan]QNO11231.1 endonuclease VII [Acinetobacter phag